MNYPKFTIALAIAFSLFTLGSGQPDQQEPADSAQEEMAQEEMAQEEMANSSEGEMMSAPEIEGLDGLPTQVALALKHYSPGVIDGLWGQNTQDTLSAFQKANGLDVTGELDDASRQALSLEGFEPLRQVTLSADDVAGPFLDELPGSLPEQAKLDALSYVSVTEKVAEMMHTTPETIEKLNPGVELAEGAKLWVPKIPQALDAPAAGELTIRVSKADQVLRLEGPDGLIFFAPVTAGSQASPLPLGDWKVVGISTDPVFYYDPSLFSDAPKDHEKAQLPPGPNNPVGVVWIDLDKEHYGIHGTPEPSKIGYTESHGCVRLANWDAQMLAQSVAAGTKVVFEQ